MIFFERIDLYLRQKWIYAGKTRQTQGGSMEIRIFHSYIPDIMQIDGFTGWCDM